MAFNAANPAAGIEARQLDNDVRTNNTGLESCINQDHELVSGGSQSGKHRQVTFLAPISTPSNSANEGYVYIKDANGKAELHFEDEDGNEIRLTAVGKLCVGNNVYFVGIDNAGTGTVNLVKINASDEIELGANSKVNGTLEVTGISTLTGAVTLTAGATFGAALAMGSNQITGLADGTASGEAIHAGQVDDSSIEFDTGADQLRVKAAGITAAMHANAANYEASSGEIYASANKDNTWEPLSTGLDKRALCFLKITADATGDDDYYAFRSAAENASIGSYNSGASAGGTTLTQLGDNCIAYIMVECDPSGDIEWKSTYSRKNVSVDLIGHLE